MKHRTLWMLLFVFLSVCVFSSTAEIWVYHQIQERLGIQIQAAYDPLLFRPSFHLSNAYFLWDGRVEFLSGDLEIQYRFWPTIMRNQIRVKISAENAKVRLLNDWAKFQGVEDAVIENLKVDFLLGPKGMDDIYLLKVDSPSFEFQIEEVDNY